MTVEQRKGGATPGLALILFLGAFALKSTAQPLPMQAAPMPADTVEFVPFPPGAGMRDCGAAADGAGPCRLRRQWEPAAVQRHLDRGESVVAGADELSFFFRGEADAVQLGGGVQYLLSPIGSTDLWVLTLRVPRVQEAVVSYFFVPLSDTPPAGPFTGRVWRGSQAPPAPDTAAVLSGVLRSSEIASRFLAEPRGVTVYLPAKRCAEDIAAVLYMADGAAVRGMAPVLDAAITAGRLPRIALVGIHSAPFRPGQDLRAAEYLLGLAGQEQRFAAHERFFVEEAVGWAEAAHALPSATQRRGVFGFSNGASFAIDMGLRHPDLFGRVIAFSPAGRAPALDASNAAAPGFYLFAGTLEPRFHARAGEWQRLLTERGVVSRFTDRVAGHDAEVWQEALPGALEWAFGRLGPAGTCAPNAHVLDDQEAG